jgi:hypothetical protein
LVGSLSARGVETAAVASLLGLLPTDAAACIDPGYGALILQAVLSGLFGAAFFARRAVARVVAGLARGFRPKPTPLSDAAQAGDHTSPLEGRRTVADTLH